MIYIISFLRRLKLKTAMFTSLPIAIIASLIFGDLMVFLILYPWLSIKLYAISFWLNHSSKATATGPACKICGFPHSLLLYPSRKKNNSQDTGSFACSSFDHGHYPDIYYCPECKNGFLKPIALNDETFIKNGESLYSDVVDEEYLKNIDARYMTNRKIAKKYNDNLEGKDILEIGCYYGAFLKPAKEIVNSYTGIEPSRHACEYLTEKWKNKSDIINIINGTLETAIEKGLVKDASFDTIVLWDVIEHVPDPIHTLKNIQRLLKPDGKVLFSTINIEASFALGMGPIWPWFMDMHYYYFSDRGYVDMLHRSGFVLKEHAHFPYYTYASYFFKKVWSIAFGKPWIPSFLEKKLQFPIPIKFGDTVMITGIKVDS